MQFVIASRPEFFTVFSGTEQITAREDDVVVPVTIPSTIYATYTQHNTTRTPSHIQCPYMYAHTSSNISNLSCASSRDNKER